MQKFVLRYGLGAGAILSLALLVTIPFADQLGDRAATLGYTAMVVAFLLIYFGVRSYRDKALGGSIGFGRALLAGALITAVAAGCYALTWELVYFKIAPGFAAKMEAAMVAKAQANPDPQVAAAKVQQAHDFARLYQNPLVNTAITFLEPLPVGLLIALICAGVLRKREALTASSS